MKTKWRWVVDWKGYYKVSNKGKIKSVERPIDSTRCKYILRESPKYIHCLVHRKGGITQCLR